ncbi:MAG: RnfABCDGE type electron transport complex subunit G [Bacteroidales bacterium]|nr:RnfABCDGE type electron transport complex subunit G [Bacteroidales bacterium]MCF8405881.1 RnfABCDGE type electron transport complex subunit G [Bacteroidales bacterium]
MAKLESNFKNMVLVLFLVTFVASGALGFVYELTKEPIRMVEINNINNAISRIISDFDNNPYEDQFKIATEKDSLVFYPAKLNNEEIGMAVETWTMKGFSGLIKLMVGFDMEGKIIDIVVLQHSETPGLGDKMKKEKSDFSLQFMGKDPANFKLSVTKDNGDVQAITASTISSRAYCDAVLRAYQAFMDIQAKNLQTDTLTSTLAH